ncbi:S-adenosyl-L-methionine-dependent methyltransferase [Aspergillus avenaceus]|uniref:S-adenosyl-L-methionine-dependent methyltransferase n=1 Tax=Aspergillus avenaceus TaxID=36643 RepID=A0A5N6TY66_ASPAV|nr:S-adenosyl-L-methionine-dependent methyltransferase [Aspergillus avenaceus]
MSGSIQLTTDPEIEPDVCISYYYLDDFVGSDDGQDQDYANEDSSYDDSFSESYRTSITSSVLNYKYGSSFPLHSSIQNGRRYNAYREGEYALPNDEEEQDRMDLLHHIYNLILNGEIHTAPLKNPQRVLDLGTGTGIWAVDFADQYQSAEVIGNDLSPIQPKWVPPNCQFEIDDFESEWSYTKPFDYIHGRELAGSIQNFPRLAQQAFTHLKPGGYFEIQSFIVEIFSDDDSLKKAPYTTQMTSLLQQASEKFGKPMANLDEWPINLKEVGFTEVTCKIVKAPATPWAKDPKQKEIGRFFQVHQVHSAPAYTNFLLSQVLGWSKTEIDILNMHFLRELKDLDVHQYGKTYIMYGRKPL